MGCDPAARQFKTVSNRILRGQLPCGLEGAIYLLIRLFIHVYLFIINIKSSMLSIRGQGTLNSIYIREDYTGLE